MFNFATFLGCGTTAFPFGAAAQYLSYYIEIVKPIFYLTAVLIVAQVGSCRINLNKQISLPI